MSCQSLGRQTGTCSCSAGQWISNGTHTRIVRAARERLTVGQDLREDVGPGDAGEAAHQPAASELLPALGRLQRVTVHRPACSADRRIGKHTPTDAAHWSADQLQYLVSGMAHCCTPEVINVGVEV